MNLMVLSELFSDKRFSDHLLQRFIIIMTVRMVCISSQAIRKYAEKYYMKQIEEYI